MKKSLFAVAFATAALALSAPADARDVSIKTGGDRTIVLGKDGDLLEQLIALDAQGIADMQADFADARREIDQAIDEIEDARADMRGVPGGRLIIRIAFATAAEATSEAAGEAMDDAYDELERAEDELRRMDISREEFVETQGAIETLRDELGLLEESLDRLSTALRGASK
jgi:hypothetical protein